MFLLHEEIESIWHLRHTAERFFKFLSLKFLLGDLYETYEISSEIEK